jgi:predicted lipid-binding transport protein (Tim44 family)
MERSAQTKPASNPNPNPNPNPSSAAAAAEAGVAMELPAGGASLGMLMASLGG